MANSDKNILITPSVGLSTNPTIKFNGANNTPTTLRVLDDGTISFEATAGQLFSISDGLTGSIFSVNDISGIPSIEVLDTGLVKLNQYGGSTVFGASSAIQNGSSVNAKVSISTVSSTTPGLIIKGVSSQTANLQEWQNSSGTVWASVSASGGMYAADRVIVSNGISVFNASSFGSPSSFAPFTYDSIVNISTVYAGAIGLVIRGIASQTNDLQQWRNSAGTVLAKVAPTGALTAYSIRTQGSSPNSDPVDNTVYNLGVGPNASSYGISWFRVKSGGAGDIASVFEGTTSQTGDLTQWRNQSGTVLASINSSGYINSSGGIKASTHGYIYTSSTQGSVSFMIADGNAAYVPLVIKGAASQTANLQEWQNSSGTYVALVDYLGTVRGTNLASNNATYTATTMWGQGIGSVADYLGDSISLLANKSVRFNATASTVSVIVKGAASQTANLTEWQDSAGGVLTAINSSGQIATYGRLTVGSSFISTDARMVLLNTGTTTSVLQIIRGIASQTGNLTEWQNSSATVLASISSAGKLTSAVDASINGITLGRGAGNISTNTASGGGALLSNTTGIYNSAFGENALGLNTTGSNNTASGVALRSNTTGSNNTASGGGALYSNTTGNYNTAFGVDALLSNNIGNYNTASGESALRSNTTGSYNTASGLSALRLNTTGNNNTALGFGAGYSNTTSSASVFIGYQAGYNETSSNKLYIANSDTATPLIGGDFSAKTLTFAGNATVVSQAAATQGLIIKGAASQTASLQEWQDSAGNLLSAIRSDGVLRVSQIISKENYSSYFTFSSGSPIQVNPLTAGTIGIVVKGVASQTANLQEWQDSAGSVVANITASGGAAANFYNSTGGQFLLTYSQGGGNLRLLKSTAAANVPGADTGVLYFRDGTTAGTLKLVVRAGTAGAETTILDNIPQS